MKMANLRSSYDTISLAQGDPELPEVGETAQPDPPQDLLVCKKGRNLGSRPYSRNGEAEWLRGLRLETGCRANPTERQNHRGHQTHRCPVATQDETHGHRVHHDGERGQRHRPREAALPGPARDTEATPRLSAAVVCAVGSEVNELHVVRDELADSGVRRTSLFPP